MSQPMVLIVEDDACLREALCETLESAGIPSVAAGDGGEAMRMLARHPVGLVVTDVQMQPIDGRALLAQLRKEHPQLPVLMMTAYGTITQAVAAMRAGASDYLVKPFEAETLVRMVRDYLPAAMPEAAVFVDPATRRLFELVRRVAASDVTVLISGESGTGKEVIARQIHACSERARGPFVAINCAAIPESMIEALLFGHEKGAFTGAAQAHAGKFEQAQGGTLLLDEISELDLGLQAKLLRVLQEREVERIGGRHAIALDVRVLATTNRRLRDEVAAGRFREDLYYRLNVFPLHLPPLRERPADIVPLARFLLARHCAGRRPLPMLSEAAVAALQAHRWPGNVRELENLLQRALILCPGTCIDIDALSFESESVVPSGGGQESAKVPEPLVGHEDLESVRRLSEHDAILAALRLGDGTRKDAARRLGISERTLRYKLSRLREAGLWPSDPVSAVTGTICASR